MRIRFTKSPKLVTPPLDKIDSIDLPGCTARWENITDVVGRQFSWINYLPDAGHEGLTGPVTPVLRDDSPLVYSMNGWIVTAEGWHQYASWYRGHSYLPDRIRLQPRLPKYRETLRLDGRVADVISDNSGAMGHVQREAAYRFFLLHEAGLLEDCDKILASKLLIGMLERHQPEIFGHYADRIVMAGPGLVYRVDEVLTAPHPSCSMNISRVQLDLLRKYLVTESKARPTIAAEKIFVPRRPDGARAIRNYDEICRYMSGRGYATVEMSQAGNPSVLAANARVMIGTHGSNLADVDFLDPGAAFMELIPSSHRKPDFKNACQLNGATHLTLLCKSEETRDTVHGVSNAFFRVDLEAFKQGVEQAEVAAGL